MVTDCGRSSDGQSAWLPTRVSRVRTPSSAPGRSPRPVAGPVDVAQQAARHLAKVKVAGSNPAIHSRPVAARAPGGVA